jgi:hypothetical protein
MNWLDNIGGLLQQYANAQGDQQKANAEQDYDEVAKHAPRQDLASGLAEAFRSPQTQPFPNMLGQLFANSNPSMKSSILNTLIATVGPQVLSGILARHSGSSAPAELGVGTRQLDAREADQIPPSVVEEMAEQAEKQDPTVIDHISDFYAQHPTVVKGLGAAALGIALNHLAKQKRGGLF